MVLAPSSPSALADYAANVSSPGNALYHHYLTVSQFAATFGPSAAAVSAVEASLRASGLTPGPLSGNHLMLPVAATAKQFATAFSVAFDQYQLSGGRVAFANTAAPLLAGAAAPYVAAVIGLDSLSTPQPLGKASTAKLLTPESAQVVTGGPQPCADALGAASPVGAYTADQLASAYGFSSLYGAGDEGAGVTIGLLELENDQPSDISAYQSCYSTSATVSYFPQAGGPTPGAGACEAALDIEDIIGLAPKAAIDVYQSPVTATGYIDDLVGMVDNPAIKVISTSWGFCESPAIASLIIAEATIFQQAAVEGQSVFAASGDDGSTGCRGSSALAVSDPASQPYVTGVGGTSLTSLSPSDQATWNDSSRTKGASGGGSRRLQGCRPTSRPPRPP